ncbi:MAG: ABC transporter ATP-binding protein [Bifidobacteriaceae bacterium]|jgi:ABC-2 type transport system ATP-binding protein|nr:ABC transporter ATP-binding protein [Bifidobacteriaceae bacterium]
MTNVIEIENVSKRFGKLKALDNINFSVEEGSVTGFLGPNGAGKSTTINILLSFISATSGSAKIFGEKVTVKNSQIHKNIGFLSNNMALDKSMTIKDELEHFAYLSGKYDKEYINELMKRLQIDPKAKIKSLSTGNYQKVSLCIALVNKPKLLILDEPTNGLDPLVQNEFNKLILELKDNGSTIFISSHILSEIDQLCDKFIFIKAGKIVASPTKDELIANSSKKIEINTKEHGSEKVLDFLKANHIEYKIKADESLEDTFMQFYKTSESEK